MTELAIWKFPLTEVYKNYVKIPKGSRILCVKLQYKKPTLWALVNPDNPLEVRTFILKETGSSFNFKIYHHIGTVLSKDDTYVLHCFEVPKGEKE